MLLKRLIYEIGQEFDNVIFDLISENFYTPSDVDNNGKIFILYSDLGGMIAGYFNQLDTTDAEGSNMAKIIYVDQMYTNFSVLESGDVISHEFQHLCHNNRDFVEEKSLDFESWIAEGLSTSAEHLYGGPQQFWISSFNGNKVVSE